MYIDVIRYYEDCDRTMGELYVNGSPFCFTLEPPQRQQHGRIAAGDYQVINYPSAKFKRMLPLLLGVPGRAGILIHAGNVPGDSAGCMLVGELNGKNLKNSRRTLDKLLRCLRGPWEQEEEIILRISEHIVQK